MFGSLPEEALGQLVEVVLVGDEDASYSVSRCGVDPREDVTQVANLASLWQEAHRFFGFSEMFFR